MKKEEYSKVNYPGLKEAKKNILKDSNHLEKMKNYIRLLNVSDEEKQRDISELFLIHHIVCEKEYKNYYIDSKELSDFFINTSIKKDILINFKKITQKESTYATDIPTGKHELDYAIQESFSGIIHSKNINRSIFFLFITTTGYSFSDIFITDGKENIYICLNPHVYKVLDFINNNEVDNNSKIIKLVLNMIFYMDAFPDKINNKPPEEVCDKLNFNNSRTISLSKDIADYLHENREVSPHLRRGHFRYLDSEYYKNKKGQTIFVKSSFVKGKAVTVAE